MARPVASDHTPSRQTLAHRGLHRWVLVELALVVADLILGLGVGITFGVPLHGHPGSSSFVAIVAGIISALSHRGPIFLIHALLGAGTWGLALVLMAWAARLRHRRLVLWLLVVLLGSTGAGLSGVSYVVYGNPLEAFLMFVGWMAALAGSLAGWTIDLPSPDPDSRP